MWIKLEGLTKSYGDFLALDDCHLEIEQGEIFGLLGPNGAGKTTLLRLLMGFICPTAGRATIGSLNTHHDSVAVRRLATYLPGDVRLYRRMRATEFLTFMHSLRSDGPGGRGSEIARRLELDLDRRIAYMSTGMRQKLALAAVLAADAQLVILDEPTSNLDPSVRQTVAELVRELRQAGRTIIFSSHVMSEVEDVCDRVAILRRGKLVHLQTIADLKHSHRITAHMQVGTPTVPTELASDVQVYRLSGNRVRIEADAKLSRILGWLATLNMEEVQIEPVGLQAVYDRFHAATPEPASAQHTRV